MAGSQQAAIVTELPRDDAGNHGSWQHRPRFELLWGQVAQGRVQTDSVIDLLDELRQVLLQFLHRVIGAGIDFLLRQRLEEALAVTVLPRPPRPTHA